MDSIGQDSMNLGPMPDDLTQAELDGETMPDADGGDSSTEKENKKPKSKRLT